MGRGSPICERERKKIVEYFKNNVLQRQIVKSLQISSSIVHNIIKIFRETGEISQCKGRGRRPLLDACGFRALRRHSITHRHDSVIDSIKWAQEYFQKLLSVNPPCHLQMPTKSLSCKKEAICEHGPEALSCPVGQSSLKWIVSKWKSVLWSDESKFDILVGNNGRHVLWDKEEGDLPESYQHSVHLCQHLWWYRGAKVHTVWAACMFWKALWMLKGI